MLFNSFEFLVFLPVVWLPSQNGEHVR